LSESVQERLLADMKKAMKEQDKLRLGAIRWIRDALQKRAKDLGHELDETESSEVLASLVKRYTDSIEQAKNAARTDVLEKEEGELRVLEEYVPKQLTNSEIESLVEQTIAETEAKGPKDMGMVMKTIKPKWAGRADGKLVSEIVKTKLTAKV